MNLVFVEVIDDDLLLSLDQKMLDHFVYDGVVLLVPLLE